MRAEAKEKAIAVERRANIEGKCTYNVRSESSELATAFTWKHVLYVEHHDSCALQTMEEAKLRKRSPAQGGAITVLLEVSK